MNTADMSSIIVALQRLSMEAPSQPNSNLTRAELPQEQVSEFALSEVDRHRVESCIGKDELSYLKGEPDFKYSTAVEITKDAIFWDKLKKNLGGHIILRLLRVGLPTIGFSLINEDSIQRHIRDFVDVETFVRRIEDNRYNQAEIIYDILNMDGFSRLSERLNTCV